MAVEDVFAPALRSAIERSGLSLAEISHRLRARGRSVSAASLSHWQSGRSRPDASHVQPILCTLEEVLGLRPDSLLSLVSTSRRGGRAMRHAEISEFIPESVPLREALAGLGFASRDSYPHERFIHERLIIDSREDQQTARFQLMVRAMNDGVCRLPSVHQMSPHEPNIAPRITPLEGCSLGRRLFWPDRRTYGAEIVVDGYLEEGQQAVLSFEVTYSSPAQLVTNLSYAVPRRAHDLMLEVEFRGAVKPVLTVKYCRTESGETSGPVRRDMADRIQVAESSFGPGLLGLRWEWDAESPTADGADTADTASA